MHAHLSGGPGLLARTTRDARRRSQLEVTHAFVAHLRGNLACDMRRIIAFNASAEIRHSTGAPGPEDGVDVSILLICHAIS